MIAPAETTAPRKRRQAPKTASEVTGETVRLSLLQRFNPIRGLTPQSLALQLDNFNLGFLSYCALTWDAIERRDDVLKGVAAKRKKDVARLKREVLTDEESPEAHAHAQALNEFYDNVTVVNALDENERGGFPLLVRQMMDAVGKKYAVHEIVWHPGDLLTAELRFTPLWFFENRTGRLRFITTLGSSEGAPLEDGGWMVTTGDGLMEPCSVAYMFKNLPLKDWLAYSDKFGTPGILGRTNAAQGSPAGQAMLQCVTSFGQNWSGVLYGDDGAIKDPLQLIQPTSAPNLPFEPLIQRMDRTMATLWRGSDLSTMSGGAETNVGASVQGDEANILIADDAAMISDTLHYYIDRWVIWQKFGTLQPKARVRIILPEKDNTDADLKIDQFLVTNGAKLGMRERMEHYGRPEIEDGDEPLGAPAKPAQSQGAEEEAANEARAVRLLELLEEFANSGRDVTNEPRDEEGRWTGSEVAMEDANWQGTATEMRERADAHMRTLTAEVNDHTGRTIRFSKQGRKKTLFDKRTPHEFQSVHALRAIIKHAKFVGSAPDRKGRMQVQSFSKFETPLRVGNSRYTVETVVKETLGEAHVDSFYLHRLHPNP